VNKRIAAVVLAGFVCVVGLVLLFVQVQADDPATGSTQCGSAAFPDNEGPDRATTPQVELDIYDRLHSQCQARIATQQTLAWVTLGIGVVGLVVSSMVFVSGRRSEPVHQ
jgi:hypothetical protein